MPPKPKPAGAPVAGDRDGVFEITEPPRVTVEIVPGDGGGLRVNRATADALALEHRIAHRVLVPADAPIAARTLSPEEKLLRSIFGELGSSEPFLDDGGLARIGETIPRGAVVIETAAFGKMRFDSADQGVVDHAGREATPAGERLTVVVRCTGAFEIGDALFSGSERLGTVESIVDDGTTSPRVWVARTSAGSGEVTRRVPSARQQVTAQAAGASDPVTQEPAGGDPIRVAVLSTLASRGFLALAGEMPGIKAAPSTSRMRTFEAMVKGEPILDAWEERLRGSVEYQKQEAATPPSSTEKSIFSFFERAAPGPPTPRLEKAIHLARAAGLDLELDGHALRLRTRTAPATKDSHGEVTSASTSPDDDDGLASQPIFGPRLDYECRCGKLKRMKFRGTRCDACSVEVLPSKVRRQRFAHLVCAGDAIAVLPPDVRPAGLDALYARVLAEPGAASRAALRAATFDALSAALAPRDALGVEYSGGAIAIVDASLSPGRARVSVDLLVALGKPLLCGWLESRGYVTTILSAKRMLAKDTPEREEALASVFSMRPLLAIGASDVPCAVVAEAAREPVIRLDLQTAGRLSVATGDRCALHLPVSERAVREARFLYQEPGAAIRSAPPQSASWLREIASLTGDAFASRIVALGASSATDPCTSLEGAVLIGGWEIAGDAGIGDEFTPPYAFTRTGAAAMPEPTENPALDRLVDELELSVRTANCLHNANIRTIRELVQRTEADLLKTRNFGRLSLKEVKQILAEMGLSLGMRL